MFRVSMATEYQVAASTVRGVETDDSPALQCFQQALILVLYKERCQ